MLEYVRFTGNREDFPISVQQWKANLEGWAGDLISLNIYN